MANIRKIGNSYKITTSCGYDIRGKQIRQYMTWTPDESMTAGQIKKELQRQEVLFEEQCKQGQIVTAAIKFEDFARQWFEEYAELKLKKQTLRNYHFAERKIYAAIGHLRMDKITPRQIQQFILSLNTPDKKGKKYAPKTIKNHICLISTIFNYAVKMQIVSFNPCQSATLPRPEQNEKDIYTYEEAQDLLNLLVKQTGNDFKFAVFFVLAIFTGLRRGELLGLEWKDVDFVRNIITVRRTSNWSKEYGVYTDTPKTEQSRRSLKITEEVKQLLTSFKEFQNEYKEGVGNKWEEHDRLFTRWNGLPMNMNSPHVWFVKFCAKSGVKYVNIHSWRHFNASVLIFQGVDIKTVQGHLGHSTPMTTLNIYSHQIQTAQAVAMEAINKVVRLERIS